MDWTPLYITIPADREAVALALYRAGYTVRQQKRKDSNKTVIYIEYRKWDDHVCQIKTVSILRM